MITLDKTSWKIVHTPHKGRAIVATQDIPAGTMIGDYVGKIVTYEEDEDSSDLYSMEYGSDLLVLADRNTVGIHLMNHSCVPNSGIYPYRDHMLYVSLRKIFAGEELTVSYMIEPHHSNPPYICLCGSPFCTGTWETTHQKSQIFDEQVHAEIKKYFKKRPGKRGDMIGPLPSYPKRFADNTLYDLYGNNDVPPVVYRGKNLSATAARKMIRTTGACIQDLVHTRVIAGVADGRVVEKQNIK